MTTCENTHCTDSADFAIENTDLCANCTIDHMIDNEVSIIRISKLTNEIDGMDSKQWLRMMTMD